MIFFTSDLHLGHENCIRLCNGTFSSIEEMDETLIENWNRKITGKDTVYMRRSPTCGRSTREDRSWTAS